MNVKCKNNEQNNRHVEGRKNCESSESRDDVGVFTVSMS